MAPLLTGCTREPMLEFAASSEVKELPEKHREQIQAALGQMFGSPQAPHGGAMAEESLTSPASESNLSESDASESDAADPANSANTEGSDAEAKSSDVEEGRAGSGLPSAAVSAREGRMRLARGAKVYQVRCAGCHGTTGDGQGPAAAYLQPKPRDYRRGVYKFTSTPYGYKPSRADLVRTIRRGAKGTSMPSFPWMSNEDLQAVTDYIVLLSQRGEVERLVAQVVATDYEEDEEIDVAEFADALADVQASWSEAESQIVPPASPEPPMDAASIERGRELFISASCFNCHGKDLKGQSEWLSHEFIAAQESLPESQRTQINRDAWGDAAPAADITARVLHGGRRSIDVYRRIYKGINGTPMPAFNQAFASEPASLWHLTHYVLSVVEGGPVEPKSTTAAFR